MVAQKDELMLGVEEWGSRGILQLTENFLATETIKSLKEAAWDLLYPFTSWETGAKA